MIHDKNRTQNGKGIKVAVDAHGVLNFRVLKGYEASFSLVASA
jgi:hypothetical protein